MKRVRWSLRSQLVAVVAVSLAMMAFELYRQSLLAHQSRIYELSARGVMVGAQLTGPRWLRDVMWVVGVNEAAFWAPIHVSFAHRDFTSSSILYPSMEKIDRSGAAVVSPPLTNTDMEWLSEALRTFPSIEVIDLSRNDHITDRGVALLPDLPRLKELDLSGTRVSDAGLEAMAKHYPNAEIVHEWAAVDDVTRGRKLPPGLLPYPPVPAGK